MWSGMRRHRGMEARFEMSGRIEPSAGGMGSPVETTTAEIHPWRAPAKTAAGFGQLRRDKHRGKQGIQK